MAADDALFAGSIPELYERLLVPLLFEFYAVDLADRIGKLDPQCVLEIAAGTGAVTREIAAKLPAEARIVATDLFLPMLDRAVAKQYDERVTWRQADALNLPFEAESFDVVACQFGAMFFSDKLRGYQEALRVLKPGGHFLFNVWDKLSANDFACVVNEALAALFPGRPPDFMARVPHGYYDVSRIQRELTAAGFSSVTVEVRDGMSRGRSAHEVATAFCQGTPLKNEIEARDPWLLDAATETSTQALATRFGNGPIEGKMRAHVIHCQR